eukprot:TRINITY_DN53_c0_g1_i2.p1 TRINITY_DN53_c0_g1~~TRINITY_DN53_c0_g1_i2.p1  ORF type:complete len:347 (-),score=-38.94 TRINITY_DN53_c0_g1_i2:262-1302(-)
MQNLQIDNHTAVLSGEMSGVESNQTAGSTCCGAPPPIPLSFSLATVLPRWCVSRFLFGASVTRGYRHTQRTLFTAGTTGVSNPVCSPSFRPSLSKLFWQTAFAIGRPSRITRFHSYPRSTVYLSQFQDCRYLLDAFTLSVKISQGTQQSSYGRFKPSNSGHHSSSRYYRGGWHRSCPALSSHMIQIYEQPASTGTQGFLITIARIVKFARLLRPVGPGFMSQNPSPGSCSHNPYRSMAWWAVTPPTTQSDAVPSQGDGSFEDAPFQDASTMEYQPQFPGSMLHLRAGQPRVTEQYAEVLHLSTRMAQSNPDSNDLWQDQPELLFFVFFLIGTQLLFLRHNHKNTTV